MRLIPIAKTYFTKVDDEDYEKFKDKTISIFPHGNNCYARMAFYDKEFYNKFKKNRIRHKFLHREIMGVCNPKISIDHIDGDGLNNQKSNLRICNHKQNCANRKKNVNGTSKYKGVQFHKRDKIWTSSIVLNGKRKHIGNFKCEKEAALSYNVAASFAYREFARLNVL